MAPAAARAVYLLEQQAGIQRLVLDDPTGVNRIGPAFGEGLREALDALRAMADLQGVILESTHGEFCAGADLDHLSAATDAPTLFAEVRLLQGLLRGLETLGVPVVALITGAALGGGLELALACHHRVAVDDPGIRLGLPEVQLGVVTGLGGTQRLARMVGFQAALDLLLQARILDPGAARERGLVDTIAPDPSAARAAAVAWIHAHPQARQPWDTPGYTWPPPAPGSPEARNLIMAGMGLLFRRTAGSWPAAEEAFRIVQEGAALGFDRALEVEARHFARVATSGAARDVIRTLWFHKNAAEKLDGLPRTEAAGARRVAVLGAGMMGAGLAWVTARAGLEVILRDVTPAALERAMDHCREQVRRAPAARRAAFQDTLDRIRPTLDLQEVAGCDLAVEAVFEDIPLKRRVLAEVVPLLAPGAIVASNTSAIPLRELATSVEDPSRFLGLHFFSPAERMPLVEVIRAAGTSTETLARALAFTRQARKVPIVVEDGYGFYTTRVFAAYILEGAQLVAEGQPPALVEWSARAVGMAVPPLQVFDEVSLALGRHVLDGARAAGRGLDPHLPGVRLVLRMLDDFHRPGRAGGRGFYDYVDGRRQGLWAGLQDLAPRGVPPADVASLGFRLLAVQAAEAVRALDEGILSRHRDADLGAVLGIGFAAVTGGPLSWLDRMGLSVAVERLDALAGRHGPRFAPAPLLRRMARDGMRFHPGSHPPAAP